MADERTRYSDAELEEFKQLILKKLENARADYELLRATITHTADNDTEDTSPTFKVLEEGAATLSKEESGRLAAHQMKFIRNLEMALVRILKLFQDELLELLEFGIAVSGSFVCHSRLLLVGFM